MKKAIVSVLGKDQKGIIARVSGALYEMDINVEDLSQTILQDYFTMIMAVELGENSPKFEDIKQRLNDLGDNIGVQISIQVKDIFDAMHRIETVRR